MLYARRGVADREAVIVRVPVVYYFSVAKHELDVRCTYKFSATDKDVDGITHADVGHIRDNEYARPGKHRHEQGVAESTGAFLLVVDVNFVNFTRLIVSQRGNVQSSAGHAGAREGERGVDAAAPFNRDSREVDSFITVEDTNAVHYPTEVGSEVGT